MIILIAAVPWQGSLFKEVMRLVPVTAQLV